MRSDRQPALPMPDAVMAAKWREAADTVMYDPLTPPRGMKQ